MQAQILDYLNYIGAKDLTPPPRFALQYAIFQVATHPYPTY
jgi:hypothetical protein